jgi:AcrR family transcriptional regulator
VEAAVVLADAGGLAAVSMRAVAGALGTSAASLYRYVTNRDELLDLGTDRVVGELRPYPDADGDWLDAMVALGRRQLALYRRHPWLLDRTPRASAVGPQTLAWFDHCLRVLEPVDAEVATKFEAIAMMTGIGTLFAHRDATAPPIGLAGLDLAPYPHLAAAAGTRPGPAPSPQDLFDRAVRSLLTGLLAVEP